MLTHRAIMAWKSIITMRTRANPNPKNNQWCVRRYFLNRKAKYLVDNIFLIIDQRRTSTVENKFKITIYHFDPIHDL